MTARTVRRVLRPQNLAAILGMGLLVVSGVGLVVGTLPLSAQVLAAVVGMAGGAAAVIKTA